MGRKAKRMNEEQARKASAAVQEAFEIFEGISSLIDKNYPKSSYVPQRYTNVWRALQGFLDLMELEVERSCLA